jgi:hypothetical protein
MGVIYDGAADAGVLNAMTANVKQRIRNPLFISAPPSKQNYENHPLLWGESAGKLGKLPLTLLNIYLNISCKFVNKIPAIFSKKLASFGFVFALS